MENQEEFDPIVIDPDVRASIRRGEISDDIARELIEESGVICPDDMGKVKELL